MFPWLHKDHPTAVDGNQLTKKYLEQVMINAQEELEVEYKRCVQDIVDYATHSSRLFYREMAFRYWILLVVDGCEWSIIYRKDMRSITEKRMFTKRSRRPIKNCYFPLSSRGMSKR